MKTETLRQKGIRFAREGKIESARRIFQTILKETPNDASTWNNMGTTYLKQGKFAEALPYYQKAIELDSFLTGSYLSAGICLIGLGLYDDALKLYDQSLEKMPESCDLWYNRAHLFMVMDRVIESIATFDHVLDLNPRDQGAVINRRKLLSKCKFEGGCTIYQKEDALLTPLSGFLYSWNGLMFLTLARDDPASKHLEKYDPDTVELYNSPEREDKRDEPEKGKDPRFAPYSLIRVTDDGKLISSVEEHSPCNPAWVDPREILSGESVCVENIISECICRSGRRYLLCVSVDYAYAQSCVTLQMFDIFKDGVVFSDPLYDDGWSEADREDCQKIWNEKRWFETLPVFAGPLTKEEP